MKTEQPFTVSRYAGTSTVPFEEAQYDDLEKALEDARLIAVGGFTVDVRVTDKSGAELFRKISSNPLP